MKKTFSEFFRFVHRFGLLQGSLLYSKIKLGFLKNIRVPGILHPLTLRKGTSDYETFYQAIVHSQYKFNYGINPRVIIDGGANIGLASIALKNMFPEAFVIAIEPDPENYAQLQENVKAYKNISTLKAGLWNKKALLSVTDKYNVGKWGMVTEEVEEMAPGVINTVTIMDIMEQFNIEQVDLLKLDIETAERELFSSDYETWLPRVKAIVIELHDFISSGTAKPFFLAINKTFRDYRFFQLGENTIIINDDLKS
jgi:FkbM family methyltransferase